MRRKNDFSVKYVAEKPGNRMYKRDRIQEILAQRFAIGSVHLKKDMYDLQNLTLEEYKDKYGKYPEYNKNGR